MEVFKDGGCSLYKVGDIILDLFEGESCGGINLNTDCTASKITQICTENVKFCEVEDDTSASSGECPLKFASTKDIILFYGPVSNLDLQFMRLDTT